VGLPAGHAIVTAGFTLEPKLASITPNSGSIGGTLITAAIHGVGTATDVSLVNPAGESICETVTVVSYS